MTSTRLSQTARWKQRVPALLIASMAPGLAACSGAPAQVQLPAKPTAAIAAAPRPPAAPTSRHRVIVALSGYVTALRQAEQSESRVTARRILGPYLIADRIGGLVQAVSHIWARGDAFYGQDVLHVLSVRVEGRHAFVHDCDNTSGMGLVYAASGQSVPGSSGVAHDNVVTRLELARGRWQVESQLVEDVPCAP